MVKNFIYVVILAAIVVPSWQIGTIILQKKNVGYMLQKQANSIKSHHRVKLIKESVKTNLETMKLPSTFSLEELSRKKVKIGYTYSGAASIFGYTYYQTSATMEYITQ